MQGFFDSLRLELKRKMYMLWLFLQDMYIVILEKYFKVRWKERGRISRDNAKMMSPETVANRVFDGYTSKKRSYFHFRGKLAHLIKNWFPKEQII